MAKAPDFDLAAAHRYFAAHCFNSAWNLIDKGDRSPEEERLMVALNQASIYHWLNRPDCDHQRLSVGYWQASRIQALLGNAGEARRHAETCLSYSAALAPFYLGYAHEAMARALLLAGDATGGAEHLSQALSLVQVIDNKDEREVLASDLAGLGQP